MGELIAEVDAAPCLQLDGVQGLGEVGPRLVYFPFRFRRLLAHSASSFRLVIVFGGAPIRSRLFPISPNTAASTRKTPLSIPATRACGEAGRGKTRASVTNRKIRKRRPNRPAAARSAPPQALLTSISFTSSLASWISCCTSRRMSSTASTVRSTSPRRPLPADRGDATSWGASGPVAIAILLPGNVKYYIERINKRL